MRALKDVRRCSRLPTPKRGGVNCMPGVANAAYVAVRIGKRELRALEPPLVDALCTAVHVSAQATVR
jgi:hypothetical protein